MRVGDSVGADCLDGFVTVVEVARDSFKVGGIDASINIILTLQ